MREGGIFDLPSALGIEVAMSDAVTEMSSCNLTSGVYSDAAKWLQGLLKEKGALSLTVDGKWGVCSESAFYKLFGVHTSQAAIAEKTGLTCAKFQGYATMSTKGCDDRSDIIYEQQAKPPAPSGGGHSINIQQAPPKTVASAFSVAPKLTAIKPAAPSVPPMDLIPPPPPQPAGPPPKSYTWLYVLLGVAVVGGVAFVMLRKKSAPALSAAPRSSAPAVMNRRRHHIRLLK